MCYPSSYNGASEATVTKCMDDQGLTVDMYMMRLRIVIYEALRKFRIDIARPKGGGGRGEGLRHLSKPHLHL